VHLSRHQLVSAREVSLPPTAPTEWST